ncbi:MAG TPA: hypothetical protein VHE35_10625 [Kofleriaceae bacterium]|nr:hypothetical protein [Kofleriaceae bacterium]
MATSPASNPLVDDRVVDFLAGDVLDLAGLARLPYFADHDRETFAAVVDGARRAARDLLYPLYKPLDDAPPRLVDGRVHVPVGFQHAAVLFNCAQLGCQIADTGL